MLDQALMFENYEIFEEICKKENIHLEDKDREVLNDRFDEVKEKISSGFKEFIDVRNKAKENKTRNIEDIMKRYCGIPPRYSAAKKTDIPSELWKESGPFLTGKSEGLYLHGQTGTGKTHLAIAIMREYLINNNPESYFSWPSYFMSEHPQYPIFKSIPDLLMEIRATFRNDPEQRYGTESAVIDRYSDGVYHDHQWPPFFIFDDLGAEKTTDWVLQTLYTVLDRRYRDMKRTIFTSNLSLDQISLKLNDRIASRIAGMCKVIELKGEDKRVRK